MKQKNNSIDIYINYKLTKMSLKEIRNKRRLTQEQLSEKSGLSVSTIHNIESDTGVNPSLKTLITYLDSLGCELNVVDK